jgi:hypothetical protein
MRDEPELERKVRSGGNACRSEQTIWSRSPTGTMWKIGREY